MSWMFNTNSLLASGDSSTVTFLAGICGFVNWKGKFTTATIRKFSYTRLKDPKPSYPTYAVSM